MGFVCGVLLRVCHFPIGTLGKVWYIIVSIPDLCTLTYFQDRLLLNGGYKFRSSLSYHLSLTSLFSLFLSSCLRQALLYLIHIAVGHDSF